MRWVDAAPWPILILGALTLGLAPFAPPHIIEKLRMLAEGRLRRPIDVFDLLLHGLPWTILFLKAARSLWR